MNAIAKPMTRWRAAGIHLVVSAALAIALAAFLFFVWYPGPLYEAGGGGRLTFLLIAINIVVGPILTLLVFRAGKRGMKFDLTVIALLQLAFLAYGLWAISAARPAFVVYVIDRFVAVGANQLAEERLAEAGRAEFGSLSWTGPVWVAATNPESPAEADRIFTSYLEGQGDLERFPKYYQHYAELAAEAGRRSLPMSELRKRNNAVPVLDAFLARTGLDPGQVGWMPLVATGSDMTVILRRDSGEVLEILPIDPW